LDVLAAFASTPARKDLLPDEGITVLLGYAGVKKKKKKIEKKKKT